MKSDFKPKQRRKGKFGKPADLPAIDWPPVYPPNWPAAAQIIEIDEDAYRRLPWLLGRE